ncbi:MAG: hypothetical protein LUQ11_03970 [Methylococcaceae bacterium]|nr:hypothetical protein [Methylococcaceae bacterium]
MNTQHKKNRLTILVIFAMSVIPFVIAWYLAKNPDTVRLGTNNGDLINPPVPTEFGEFSGYDAFTAENLKELQGHWVLINPVSETQCGEVCRDALHKTRQISLMMGKDISRIRRAAILFEKTDRSPFSGEWQDDARLLKIVASTPLHEKLGKIAGSPIAEGMLLIMDPLGNLMMKYPASFDPYKVRNDLSKLLRISQIG